MKFINIAGLAFCVVAITSCSETESNGVMNNTPEVNAVKVIKKDVPVFQEFVGEVFGFYDIPIRARVDGFLEGRFFEEGNDVKKGQLLYVIDAQSYRAEVASKKSDVAQARTYLVNAENDLNRIRPLAEKKAVSQSELDAAIAEEGAARAAVEAAIAKQELAQINLDYTKIHSPISGVIGRTKAKRGEYVGKEPNPVILNAVSRIDTILVQFFITESEYLQVARQFIENESKESGTRKPRDPKNNLDLILSDGSTHNYKGNVDFIDREVDPTTGSMLVQASFPNPESLIRPGQFAKVKVHLKTNTDAKLIPLRCISSVQGKMNVYVINSEQKAEMKEVVIEATYGDLVLISGLDFDELVVIDGIQKIRSGMTVQANEVNFESQSNNPF